MLYKKLTQNIKKNYSASKPGKLHPNSKSIYILNLCPSPRTSELALEQKKSKIYFQASFFYLKFII